MYVHDLDPFAIQFTETLGVRWYGLAYLAGFLSGYAVILTLIRRQLSLLSEAKLGDFITYVAIGTLVGGRLGYGLFYAPQLFWEIDSHFPYWGILKVNEGGMASHGGILGVMVTCWLFARSQKISVLHLIDLTVLGGSLGIFFGRIANFINGELYGRAAPESWWGAVKFPQEMYMWTHNEVNKLFSLGPAAEALGKMVTEHQEIINLDRSLWRGWVENYSHDMGSRNAVNLAIEKMIVAVQSGNQQVVEALAPVLTSRFPSQLYQALLEGLLVFIALTWIWRSPRRPGVISGWFGVFYCVARIVGEQFRMPDADIGFQLFGLTRGQWISFGFLLFAIGYLVVNSKRSTPLLGGWGQRRA